MGTSRGRRGGGRGGGLRSSSLEEAVFWSAKVRMGKHLQDKHDAERSRQTLNLNTMRPTLPDELTRFPLTNIPLPRKAGLSFSAVLLCFSTLPLASVLCGQHTLWTLPLLAVLLGHLSSPTFGSNGSNDRAFLAKWSWHSVAHCLWGHTAVPIAAPIGHSSTAVRGFPSCPIEKEGPKGFSEHRFRGPATSQTIRDHSTAPIHFPLLLPHRYPQEKTNLQKNSPCQLTSPPKCMMTPNSCLRGYLFS